MEVVDALRAAGYEVRLEGDSVAWQWVSEGSPDPELARPLIEALKQEKAEAVEALREEQRTCDDIPPFGPATATGKAGRSEKPLGEMSVQELSGFVRWAREESNRLATMDGENRTAAFEVFERTCKQFDVLPTRRKRKAISLP